MTEALVVAVPVVGLCAGALLFQRARTLPVATANASLADTTVIIPARDEEANLASLLTSLRASDQQPAEIVVVDDDSGDATAAVAQMHGATVIRADARPDDWKGKPWACWQGAHHATTPLLLFVDADVRFLPNALSRIRTFFGNAALPHALSVLPHHVTYESYEELSLFFNIVLATGAGGFSAGEAHHGLFGHSLLIQRDLYLGVGGHGAVRQHVLENVHLAPYLRAAGGTVDAVLGTGLLTMRMFPDGLQSLRASWMKGFAGGAAATSRQTLLLCIVWLTGAATPVVALLLGSLHLRVVAAVLYLLYVFQIRNLARKVGTFRWSTAVVYFIPLVFYFALFAGSALRRRTGRTVLWKGRPV